MKRLSILTAVLLALPALPAVAEVNIYADIYKDKDINVYEDIYKDKDVIIDVFVDAVTLDKGAESATIGNQENIGNSACENCFEKEAEMIDSMLSNVGITSVNQDAGNMDNQGIAVSVGYDIDIPVDGQTSSGGFAEAQASVEQNASGNTVFSQNVPWRYTELNNSVNDNTGITSVNQSAGNMNNQFNAVSVAISLSGLVALSEADLGQWNGDNTVTENGVVKWDKMIDSVNGNVGITSVNQNVGNMNNQANVVSFAGINPLR